jgi:hypothetical protein
MRLRSATRTLLVGLLLAALAAPGGAGAELWRWIDEQGIARFTPDPDRVPASRRSTLVRVEAGMPPVPPPEPAVAKPLPIFAPPGDPALAQDPWNAPERAQEVEGQTLIDTREIIVELPTAAPPSAPATPPGPTEAVTPPPAQPETTSRVVPPAPPETTSRVVPPAPPETTSRVAPPAPPEATSRALPQTPPEAETQALATAARPASPPPIAPSAPMKPLSRDAEERRAELASAIAADEEALKAHVSSADDVSILASPELRAIAERLPALQAELRALEAQSAAP